MRLAKWARRPPSRRRLALIVVVLVLSLAIVSVEKAGLWPEWARAAPLR
jgi:hypothetical protein